MNDSTKGSADQGGPVIQPVTYRPRDEGPARRFTVTPLQILLLGLTLPVVVALWFLFTAKSVRLELSPPAETVSVSGGLSLELGGVLLLREGAYRLTATAPGYEPLDAPLAVSEARNQTVRLAFTPLPGQVTFTSTPPGAEVVMGGATLGITPTEPLSVPAGPQTLSMLRERYQPLALDAEIIGRGEAQTVHGELVPDWADVRVDSEPAGAEIFVDDVATGQTTPAVVELITGEHEIRLAAPGHKPHRQRLLVAALEQITLPMVKLERADGLLRVTTRPSGAGITLDGQYQGESPVELAVESGRSYRLQVFRAGYAAEERRFRLDSGEQRDLSIPLTQLTGQLAVTVQPADAMLSINGREVGPGSQTLSLPTVPHRLAITLDGYAAYRTEITPKQGLTQELKVRLLTLEEARLAALTPEVTTAAGQTLVLLSPKPFTMGASRREPGRRANETLREVTMTRLFYLGRREVTNAEFRAFASGHDSGEFQEYDLNEDEFPVARVSWTDAALYCNWLSDRDGLPPFYRTEPGRVVGINPGATGYRLPTEAEWAWSARQVNVTATPLRFPWGPDLPPPDRHGNYADRSAANLVGRVIFGYNDNHIVAAPVGTFAADANGIHDLAGNVAEWVHDFYELPDATPVTDPLGPDSGDYHTIRGSSWMHGTITDLRLSFRDYGAEGRADVGFRLARFAEAP